MIEGKKGTREESEERTSVPKGSSCVERSPRSRSSDGRSANASRKLREREGHTSWTQRQARQRRDEESR
jgi:hypothetical protein